MSYQIFVSDLAIKNINKQIMKRTIKPFHLRFGVIGGACSGYKYFFEFEDRKAKITDHIFNFDDFTIVVDKKSILLLNGTTIDWKQELMETGYVFNNPNAQKTCSCGESFSIK